MKIKILKVGGLVLGLPSDKRVFVQGDVVEVARNLPQVKLWLRHRQVLALDEDLDDDMPDDLLALASAETTAMAATRALLGRGSHSEVDLRTPAQKLRAIADAKTAAAKEAFDEAEAAKKTAEEGAANPALSAADKGKLTKQANAADQAYVAAGQAMEEAEKVAQAAESAESG